MAEDEAARVARIIRGVDEGDAADDLTDPDAVRRATKGMRICEILREMNMKAPAEDQRWAKVRWNVKVRFDMVNSWNNLHINIDFELREMGNRVRSIMRSVAAMGQRGMHDQRNTVQTNRLMEELENIFDRYYEEEDDMNDAVIGGDGGDGGDRTQRGGVSGGGGKNKAGR